MGCGSSHDTSANEQKFKTMQLPAGMCVLHVDTLKNTICDLSGNFVTEPILISKNFYDVQAKEFNKEFLFFKIKGAKKVVVIVDVALDSSLTMLHIM